MSHSDHSYCDVRCGMGDMGGDGICIILFVLLWYSGDVRVFSVVLVVAYGRMRDVVSTWVLLTGMAVLLVPPTGPSLSLLSSVGVGGMIGVDHNCSVSGVGVGGAADAVHRSLSVFGVDGTVAGAAHSSSSLLSSAASAALLEKDAVTELSLLLKTAAFAYVHIIVVVVGGGGNGDGGVGVFLGSKNFCCASYASNFFSTLS